MSGAWQRSDLLHSVQYLPATFVPKTLVDTGVSHRRVNSTGEQPASQTGEASKHAAGHNTILAQVNKPSPAIPCQPRNVGQCAYSAHITLYSRYLKWNAGDLDLGWFKANQGQRSWCQSIAHGRLPIWLPLAPLSYLSLVLKYFMSNFHDLQLEGFKVELSGNYFFNRINNGVNVLTHD